MQADLLRNALFDSFLDISDVNAQNWLNEQTTHVLFDAHAWPSFLIERRYDWKNLSSGHECITSLSHM